MTASEFSGDDRSTTARNELADRLHELDQLVDAAELQLRELRAISDPVPMGLRGTALRSSRVATDLLAAADEQPGPAGAAARELAIVLMCASNRAMAMWAKRVGRMPLDAFFSLQPDDGRGDRGQ